MLGLALALTALMLWLARRVRLTPPDHPAFDRRFRRLALAASALMAVLMIGTTVTA